MVGFSSRTVNSDRKKPAGDKSRVSFGHRTTGGGIDEDRARTNFASVVVNPDTSREIAHTLL
jgi:hypothetical protein